MKKISIFIFILIVFAQTNASKLDVSLTDNIYNTSSREYDLLLNAELNGKINSEKADLFYNFGLYTPFINNYMMSFPSDISFQYVPADNANRTLMLGVYSFETFYAFTEYKENNMIAPGIFFDDKEYVSDYLIVKNSLDARSENYLFLSDFSSTKVEGSTKWMVGLPIKMSLHLGGFIGYKLNPNENPVMKWSVSPLLGINLFDFLGLSLSGKYSKSSDETLSYYLDDTFIDEYFYDETEIKGKATLLFGKQNKLVFSASYSMRDFSPLLHTSDADSTYMTGSYEDRADDIFVVDAVLKMNLESISPYLNYVYENRKSSNAQYSFSSNSITLGIEF